MFLGSDLRRQTRRRQCSEQDDEFHQCGDRDLRLRIEREAGAVFAREHPFRDERPGPIDQLAGEPVAAVGQTLPALGGQRLAYERVPRIVNGDRA
jgi:hypothetical protein